MLMRPPRVAAIHDLSGFGRCSLTVILPVLSVMGIQVVPLTTALLSTHTGGFSNVVMQDLTGYIPKAVGQYRKEGIEFECIYTGFLSSEQQFDDCLEVLDAYPHAMAVVDPVMGDHGRIYKTYTRKMCKRVGELVHRANLITPNPTEVALLLDEDPVMLPLTAQQYKTKLLRLSELGPKQVIITGAQLADHTMNNIVHIGEIPIHVPVVVNLNGLAPGNPVRKLEVGHIWPSVGPVHRKEAQPRGRNAVQMSIGKGHELVALFGGRVQADGMIHIVVGGKRGLLLIPVH